MAHSIVLFGASSLLGFHLARMFPKTVVPFISPGNKMRALRGWFPLQLHDSAWIAHIFEHSQPTILVYCHAVCDVPKCEANPDWAYEVNVGHLGRVIQLLPDDTRFVYISSDHVFGGDGIYTEQSSPSPISQYGRTRVEAEQLVLQRSGSLVIRAGLGIGASSNGRTGHLDWLRYRASRQLPMTIIHDEHRSAVWQADLAMRIMQLAHSHETGIRHVAATRVVSRLELAHYILRTFLIPATLNVESRFQQAYPHLGSVELRTIHSDDLSHPLASVLDTSRRGHKKEVDNLGP